MTRRSETCRPAMLGMLDMLSTTFMTRDPGQRMTRHYGLSGDRLEAECGSRQTLKPAQGSVVGLVPDLKRVRSQGARAGTGSGRSALRPIPRRDGS